MGFEKIHITNSGMNLAKKTLEGKKIEFTKFEIGKGEPPENIETAEALSDKVMDLKITSIDKTNKTQIVPKCLFKSTAAPESFYFKELGLFAKDIETQEEVLFAYGNAGDTAEYIDNVAPIKEIYIELPIAVGDAENVQIIIDPSTVYVTFKEFEANIAHYYRLDITQDHIADNSEVEIPCYYKFGANCMEVRLNGFPLVLATETQDGHYKEVGEEGAISNRIQIYQWTEEDDTEDVGLDKGDILEFLVKGEYNI